jgi:hypothetical protein
VEVVMIRILAGGPTRGLDSAHAAAWRECIVGQRVEGVEVVFGCVEADGDGYAVREGGHDWSAVAVQRVAMARQAFIDAAEEGGYDAVWMVDDDVLCGPGTLARLLSEAALNGAGVAVGVYWTPGWDAAQPARELPQVWHHHPYSVDEALIETLRNGGVVHVAGGGACTLMLGEAMRGAVYWPPLRGVEMWWEDRWACLRWAAREVGVLAVGGLPIIHAYGLEQRTAVAVDAAMREVGWRGDAVSPVSVALPHVERPLPALVLALPWYGGVKTPTAVSVLRLASAWTSTVYLSAAERSQVEVARDLLTDRIATSAAPDDAVVLWVDADMTFDNVEVGRMIAAVRDGEIVGAAGRQKRAEVRFCVRHLTPGPDDGRGWVRGMTGGAVVAMRVSTLRRLHGAGRPYRVGGEWIRQVWPVGIDAEGEHTSEDFGMFALAQAIGIDTYVDPWVTLGHIGDHEYTGRLADALWPS